MLPDRGEHRPQGRLGGVIPQAKIGGRDAAHSFDSGRLDAQHGGARQCQMAKMDHVPCGRLPAFG